MCLVVTQDILWETRTPCPVSFSGVRGWEVVVLSDGQRDQQTGKGPASILGGWASRGGGCREPHPEVPRLVLHLQASLGSAQLDQPQGAVSTGPQGQEAQ